MPSDAVKILWTVNRRTVERILAPASFMYLGLLGTSKSLVLFLAARTRELASFREKMGKELRAGLVSLILLLVIERKGPEYGYRILRLIEEQSDGELAFKEGTAYPLLANLAKRGLVESFWGEGDAGPPRKYYRITPLGRRALAQALADWRALNATVEDVIEGFEEEDT